MYLYLCLIRQLLKSIYLYITDKFKMSKILFLLLNGIDFAHSDQEQKDKRIPTICTHLQIMLKQY